MGRAIGPLNLRILRNSLFCPCLSVKFEANFRLRLAYEFSFTYYSQGIAEKLVKILWDSSVLSNACKNEMVYDCPVFLRFFFFKASQHTNMATAVRFLGTKWTSDRHLPICNLIKNQS